MELTSGWLFFFAVHTRNRLYIAATYPDSLGWSKPGTHAIMEIIHELWWVAWFHLQYTCCIPVCPHEIRVFLLVFEKHLLDRHRWLVSTRLNLQGHCGYWTSMLGGGLMFFLMPWTGGDSYKRSYTSLPHQKRNICWTHNLANKIK